MLPRTWENPEIANEELGGIMVMLIIVYNSLRAPLLKSTAEFGFVFAFLFTFISIWLLIHPHLEYITPGNLLPVVHSGKACQVRRHSLG